MNFELEANQIIHDAELKYLSKVLRIKSFTKLEEELNRLTDVPHIDHEEKSIMNRAIVKVEQLNTAKKIDWIITAIACELGWDGTGNPMFWLDETQTGWDNNFDWSDDSAVEDLYKTLRGKGL